MAAIKFLFVWDLYYKICYILMHLSGFPSKFIRVRNTRHIVQVQSWYRINCMDHFKSKIRWFWASKTVFNISKTESDRACSHSLNFAACLRLRHPSQSLRGRQVSYQRWNWNPFHEGEVFRSMQARYPPWLWNPELTSPRVQNRPINGATKD